jgi:agmatinase
VTGWEQRYDTFLGLEPECCLYESSRVVLLPVPYDATASYRGGARRGPRAILEASSQLELWDLELGREIWPVGIHALPSLAPSAVGPEQMIGHVEQACLGPLGDGKLVFTLGGEHSITVGAARAVAQLHQPLTFVLIDAHLDLRESYEGSRYSHATVARRLLEIGAVVHVGARVACEEELDLLEARSLDPVWAHQIQQLRQEEWIERVLGQIDRDHKVYVSVDVDGLDPSVVPATGTPVPGGLGWYQTLSLLRAIGEHPSQVVGCDLCELAPIPMQPASDFAAAMLAYKMIGYFVSVG